MQTQIQQARVRLERLIEINQLLMSTVEPDDLLQEILQSAIRIFSVEGCTIALIDETEEQLAFVFSVGGAKVEEVRIGLGQGIAGWVAQTGQGVVSNNVAEDPRFFGEIDHKTGFRTKSILCAPLKQRDQLIGAIEALNTTNPNGFTQEDLQLLTAFGGLAATAINRAKVFAAIRNTNAAFQEAVQDRYRLVTGTSAAMEEALRIAHTVASTNTTVLLLGESGTGKEVIARAIHQWSLRADHPFIPINCVALTPDLLESELFGHEKGAFTGAIALKKGKFELAHGGTIFLDEIGELAPNLQTKLLRVLQEREFQRVGGVKDIRTDVRIMAATNRDLRQAMQKGSFREDLYYRLNVVSITLPPLRERKEDIPVLIDHFLNRFCREVKRDPIGIERPAMESLQLYSWPGNVRELQNAIERAVVLSPGGANITEGDLSAEVRKPTHSAGDTSVQVQAINENLPLGEAVDEFKRAMIRNALEATAGNQTQAAKILGLRQSNFSRMLKTLEIR